MISFFKKAILPILCCLLMAACTGNTNAATGTGANTDKVTGLEDLKGKTVGVTTGSLTDLEFDKLAPGAIKQLYNYTTDLLVALDKGKAQFLLMDSVMVIGLDKREHPIEAVYSQKADEVGLAFRKTDEDLRDSFNEFLAQIKADGTHKEMVDRWLNNFSDDSETPQIEEFTEGVPIKVGIITMLPTSFIKNGKWDGFEVEMMRRFAAYLHRPVEFSSFEFSALMAALKTGVIDIWCAYVTITEERAREVLFSDPYILSPVTLFRRSAEQTETQPFYRKAVNSFRKNLLVENRWKMLVEGLWETIIISIISLLLGTLLGALICLLRMSKNKFLADFAKVYVEILRGVPMLVLLMVMFYIVLSSTGISGRWVAIISFAINFSAYVCEIFRSGISSVDKGQTEAGLAMGFNKPKTFFHFIIPQALKNILPVFKNEAISLIKGTSIVGYVAIQDLTKMSDTIRSRTFDAFFPLIIISILYFFLAWLFGKALDCLGKKIA